MIKPITKDEFWGSARGWIKGCFPLFFVTLLVTILKLGEWLISQPVGACK